MSALKNNIKTKFENKQLSGEQLQILQRMQNDSLGRSMQNIWKRYAIALSIVFVMTITGFMTINKTGSATVVEKIAYEVATQHVKLKPLDISSDKFIEVQSYFEKLDFRPVRLEQIQGALIGGRYCSLLGEPAAQFRYIDKSGNEQTLYQAEYASVQFNELANNTAPETIYAKGVPITIWMDKGIVFALTQ